MTLRSCVSFGLVALATTACIVPENQKPDVGIGGELATKFVHRGMTQGDKLVVQPRLSVRVPVENGDSINLVARANVDLSNDTGDAWFPDGHAGRATQIDFVADYQKTIGDITLRAGVFNYNLPNGTEFVNGERGGTSELFVTASANVLEATPYVSWHYDFDEVRAAYYRGGITESFDLGGDFSIVLDGSLGYASSSQSAWLYGIDESGLADLRGEATLLYRYDARTQLTASINGSAIMDSRIDDWFTQLGIDDDPIWFTIGVAWSL